MIFKAIRVEPRKYILAMDGQALALTLASLETALDVLHSNPQIHVSREAELEAGLQRAIQEIKLLAKT